MKVRLIRDARVKHYAGEIVEVSPEEFQFFVSLGTAVPLNDEPVKEEQPKKRTRKAG